MTKKVHYGVNRMILINSGRYGFAEVDLQTPVHLAAGNNQGKSTLVNALQFLYINDLGNMKFPNSDEETTRHYFGGRNSYLIYECSTFAGLKTILLRGLTKLQSGRYERYSYEGGFRKEDYLDGKKIKDFEEVRASLADRHLTQVKNSELWQVLSGSATRKGDTSASVKILPVKNEEAYRDFCRVYKKLLTLADLDSSALRDLVIACHSRNIGPKKIDIANDYRDEFERAERQEYEFGFITEAATIVRDGLESRSIVTDLKAKLIESVPGVWQTATDLICELSKANAIADGELEEVKTQLDEANTDKEKLIWQSGRLEKQLENKTEELNQLNEDHRLRWSSYSTETITTIERNLTEKQLQIVKLEESLDQVGQLDTDTLSREYQRKQKCLENDKRTLANWNSTLGAFLARRGFDGRELQLLFQLVNTSAHSAIIGEQVEIKDEDRLVGQCRKLLAQFAGTHFVNDFIDVNVENFSTIRAEDLKDSSALENRISISEQSLAEDKLKLDVALNEKPKRAQLEELRTSLKETQTELNDYREFVKRWALKSDLERQRIELQEEADKVQSEQEKIENRKQELTSRKSSATQTKGTCETQKQGIVASFNELCNELTNLGLETQAIPLDGEVNPDRLRETKPTASDIAELESKAVAVIDLVKQLKGDAGKVITADQVVQRSETEIKRLSRQQDFVGQELYFDNRDEEWNGLAAKVDAIDAMQTSLDNAWDSLFKTLSGRLNGILQGVNEVKKAVGRISSGLGRFQVSNLQGVALRVETDSSVYPVIEEICQQDGLFQDRDEQENAKKRLKSWIKVAKVITIDSMFSLKISGTEADGTPINAASLDKIGSTGTGITIKAMILCQLMRALVPDNKYHLHFFIDETGRLDDPNLSATVQMAVNQSVIPITAEPKIKLESLAHPAVMIYSLGTSSDGKFKVDSKRSYRARKIEKAETETALEAEQKHVAS